jgi:hypothetical protein
MINQAMVRGRMCQLCRSGEPLRRSHLLPRAFYRDLRTPELANPNPILITEGGTEIDQKQVTAELLCASCEQRFNQGGEHWVLAHAYRVGASFRLYDTLSTATPLAQYESGTVYSGASIGDVAMERLVYFGMSVFWRAAAIAWENTENRGALLSLGPYQETFRQFLLRSGAFPPCAAIWVAVVRNPVPPPVLSFPWGHRVETYFQHNFAVPGVSFTLFVGSRIPDHVRTLCAAQSPERIIFFTDLVDIIDRDLHRLTEYRVQVADCCGLAMCDRRNRL